MGELKTKKNDASVDDFLMKVEDEQQRLDSFELLKIFEEVTGEEASMWGDSIVGFGDYHYESKKSTQKGDWFYCGFSPRVGKISIYLMNYFENMEDLISKLGKCKTGKCCLYIKKLSDVDLDILKQVIKKGYEDAKVIN